MKETLFMVIAFAFTFSNGLNAQIKSIKIGKQIWMSENLNLEVPGSWHYNEDNELGQKYGRLYSWDAAKNACPAGWHLPSDDEWTELVEFAGGEDVAAKKLKLTGESGFNALLAGYTDRHSYWFLENLGGYWSSTNYDDNHAWYRYFTKKGDAFTKTYFSKNYGFSVRCVKN